MAVNPVSNYYVKAIRKTAGGTYQIRFWMQVEEGNEPATDLTPGWYIVNVNVDNLRVRDGTDPPFTLQEIVEDETRPVEERLTAMQELNPPPQLLPDEPEPPPDP